VSKAVLMRVITKQELKAHRNRVSELAAGTIAGKITKEAMAAMQGAMMVALIVAS